MRGQVFALFAVLVLSGLSLAEATQSEALQAIQSVVPYLQAAEAAGKDVSAALAKYDAANVKFADGDYGAAISLSNEAIALAQSAPQKESPAPAGAPSTPPAAPPEGDESPPAAPQPPAEAGEAVTSQQGTTPPVPEPAVSINWLLIAGVLSALALLIAVFFAGVWYFFIRKRY